MTPNLAYVFVIASSVCFSGASLVFASVSRRLSPMWMNIAKVLVAWTAFAVTVFAFGSWAPIGMASTLALLASGALGLAIGDAFLLAAYARIGAARTLILFGFQPLFLGTASYYMFGQELSWVKAVAVVFFVGCLFVFSLERYHQEGRWELGGLAAALVAVLFDNTGVILSRWAFENAQGLDPLQANLVRCTGAIALFAVLGTTLRVPLAAGWRRLDRPSRGLVIAASLVGCFLSLLLYLSALRTGHVATIAAIGGGGPIFASAFECAYHRRAPSLYLVCALVLFLCGFGLLTLT